MGSSSRWKSLWLPPKLSNMGKMTIVVDQMWFFQKYVENKCASSKKYLENMVMCFRKSQLVEIFNELSLLYLIICFKHQQPATLQQCIVYFLTNSLHCFMSIANTIRKFIESSSRVSYLASVTLPGLPTTVSQWVHGSHNVVLICQVSGCRLVAWYCSQTTHHSPSKAMQILYLFACVSIGPLPLQLRDLNSLFVLLTLGRTSLVIFSYLLVECMIQQYDIIITFWWLSSIIAFSRSQFLILRNFGVTVNQAFPSLPPYKTISYLPYRNNMLHQSRLRYNTADYRKEEGPDILHRSSSRPPGSTLRAMLRTSTADSHLDKFY